MKEKGYHQHDDIYFEETHILVSRLDAFGMIIVLYYIMDLKKNQMEVKSACLNVSIQDEV